MSRREVSLGVVVMMMVVQDRYVNGLTQPELYNARPRKLQSGCTSKQTERGWW